MSESNDILRARERQFGRCVCGHLRTDHDFIYTPVPHGGREVTGNTARIVEPCRANDVCPCRDWVLDQDQASVPPFRDEAMTHCVCCDYYEAEPNAPDDEAECVAEADGDREYWESRALTEERNNYQGSV